MPFDKDPPLMPGAPGSWKNKGLVGGLQAECVWAEFGATEASRMSVLTGQVTKKSCEKVKALGSGGMSSCTGIFLFFTVQNRRFGAVIHFDSSGDPGDILNYILAKFGKSNPQGRQGSTVFLVSGDTNMSANAAYNSVVAAGFTHIVQYAMAHGSAAMDDQGNVFDPYPD